MARTATAQGIGGSRTARWAAVAGLAAAAAAALAAPAPARAAEAFVGVDVTGQMVTFSSARPQIARRRDITGLPAGEEIVGLDVRPLTRTVVALSDASRLYTLDPVAASVTAIGTAPFAPALVGQSFGFDFNPTVDRIRVVSNLRQNLRLNPITGATAAVDGALAYVAGDANAGQPAGVTASAYTNSFAGATTTQLFGIDTVRNVLALQNPPNAGGLATVGALGVDATSPSAFDIVNVAGGTAYAALRLAGTRGSRLYTINLATGGATAVGPIRGATVSALAIRGTIPLLASKARTARRPCRAAGAGLGGRR